MVLGAFTAGCSVRTGAPVIERGSGSKSTTTAPRASRTEARPSSDARPDWYTVRKGDTLFSIALDQGLDYRELADWNGISDPGVIKVGQTLRLWPPGGSASVAPVRTARGIEGHPISGGPQSGPSATGGVKTAPKAIRAPYSDQALAQLSQSAKPATAATSTRSPGRVSSKPASGGESGVIKWEWPADGKVISTFNDAAKLKGISIAGKLGQPVVASAAGRVIFSGTGIRGFGKLIVIKHNDTFLSVYAHNKELLVKEGESVAKGQKIAEMGKSDTDRVKLHFEIRRFGKPVDPMTLLPQG